MNRLAKVFGVLAALAVLATFALGYAAIWTGGPEGGDLADSAFLTFMVAFLLVIGAAVASGD